MNPDFVRIIDYYVGIPLCAVLSIGKRIFGFFSPGSEPVRKAALKKALFIELSEMGSALLAYPAIFRIQKVLPHLQCYFLIFARNKESVSLLGCIDEDKILVIRDDNLFVFLLDIIKIFIVNRIKFDICFDLELFSRCTSILSFLSGARYTVGFYSYYSEGLYRGRLLTHEVSYNPYQHMSLNFDSLVDSALENISGPPFGENKPLIEGSAIPAYSPNEIIRESIINRLKRHNQTIDADQKIVVLNPYSGSFLPIRSWDIENYIDLSKNIIERTEAFVVIAGLFEGKYLGDQIVSRINDPRCINFMGETESLVELIELFSLSNILVTSDGGPAHIACLTEISIIALFGPETPVLYGPLSEKCKILHTSLQCSPCLSAFNHRKTPCKDNKCLKLITANEVFSYVEAFLKH